MTASTETPDWTGQQIAYSHGGDLIKLSEAISIAIAAAVAAETERCAKVALYFGDRRGPRISKTGGEIATAIRSRRP